MKLNNYYIMDIDKITLQVLNDKPKPKFTYGLNLDINTDVNQQFEIICLMFLRTIEEKVIKEIKIEEPKELKKQILKELFLSKLYLNSCGVDFKYTVLQKKNCVNYNLSNKTNFYSKNKYNSLFCIVQNVYKKGRKFETYYNMKKINSYKDLFIIIKIKNFYFKIELDLLKK